MGRLDSGHKNLSFWDPQYLLHMFALWGRMQLLYLPSFLGVPNPPSFASQSLPHSPLQIIRASPRGLLDFLLFAQ